MKTVIRYTNDGTINGKIVGDVYVLDVAEAVASYPPRWAFTYTKNPEEASHFTPTEAADLLAAHGSWGGYVVPLDTAEMLA